VRLVCFVVSCLLVCPSLCFSASKKSCVISLSSRNGENFFDWIPNDNVADWGYRNERLTSLVGGKASESAEWNRALFEAKLSQYLEFEKELGVSDIAAAVEIERGNATNQIAQSAGYEYVVSTAGDDPRGIDNHVFVKDRPEVVITRTRAHRAEGRNFSGHPTRQILEVQFRIKDKYDLILFVNHWPSQMGPTESRWDMANQLRTLVWQRQDENPDVAIIATGDFNVIDNEKNPEIHPFDTQLLSRKKKPYLVDVHDHVLLAYPEKKFAAPGTYYFIPRKKDAPHEWNRLDRFLVTPNLLGDSGLRVDLRSYAIVVTKVSSMELETPQGKVVIPKSFDPATLTGVTDHFPIRMKLIAP
jgi:hypothetical protein